MDAEFKRSIAIVGPGAIGTTVAASLHEFGRTPLICGRTPHQQLTLQDGEHLITVPGPVRTDPSQIHRPVDLVFFSVKATQIATAAEWLAALSSEDTVICVLQNGVEQLKILAPYATRGHVVPAIVWFPAQAQPDATVLLRGEPCISLPDSPASRVVADALQGTRCYVDRVANFSSLAWRKLMQNAVAGLMALTRRHSGMFSRADISQLTLAYLQECLLVARAEGVELSDTVPQEILEKFQASPADLGTSILADREAGRPLEWDIRNGVILRLGKAHGIPTPVSEVVVPLLAAASDGPG